jgi:cytosine/adenosine deaminase-related metal-dependent hydrolase
MWIRGRFLFPVTAPAIEDGAVLVSGERIAAVGPWRDLQPHRSGPVTDLGDVVLLPGLINAHCHLDYTDFAGLLPVPRRFTDWIQSVLALKAHWGFSEYAASWLAGTRQLLASGCTTVLDFEAIPELLPDAWQGTPLRVISALEMTGVRSGLDPAGILDNALARIDALGHTRCAAALAPHAPYSTRPQLLRMAALAARSRRLLLSMHVAESFEEFDMFQHARGPMHAWLSGQRDMSDCGRGSPVRHVAEAGVLGQNCVLAHVNYLEEGDAARLAATGTSVVHCPRSHAYFGHAPFPRAALRAAAVNMCLGTDSLLTVRKLKRAVPRLSLFEELAAAAAAFPELAPEGLIDMVTCRAARAIGRSGDLGVLRPSALADIVAVPFAGRTEQLADAIVHNSAPVTAAMIGGEWVRGGSK